MHIKFTITLSSTFTAREVVHTPLKELKSSSFGSKRTVINTWLLVDKVQSSTVKSFNYFRTHYFVMSGFKYT